MPLSLRSFIRAGVLVAFCLSAVSFGAAGKPANLDGFARCLGEKQSAMYGAFWCDHCREQKELFGNSAQYLPYVECVEKGTRKVTEQCKALGIRRTPTWIFEQSGERVEGKVLSLQELSQKTGCKLP
jgi:thiol-disulfide isomerase/thioredoxin